MAQKKKALKKRHTQISIYAPPLLYDQVVAEAAKRRRKLGPVCMEILHEYFDKGAHDGGSNIAQAS
jgi:hypothetical protein